jgi:hypothetical protein
MNEAYKKQVKLLLDVLPEVAKEECFAMHGGTAINLFVRDMPRLSVDIDLTYVEIADRNEGSTPFPRTVVKRLKTSNPSSPLAVAFSGCGIVRCS